MPGTPQPRIASPLQNYGHPPAAIKTSAFSHSTVDRNLQSTFDMMENFTAMASRKRSRGVEDDEGAFGGFGASWDDAKKRRRNDTLGEGIFAGHTEQSHFTPNPFHTSASRPGINRAHTLPFRLPSFTIPNSLHSPDSESASLESTSPASLASLPPLPEPTMSEMDTDMDMDMGDNVVIRGSQSPESPFAVPRRPPKLHPSALLQTTMENTHFAHGRLPTPISGHGQHFASPRNQFASGRVATPIHHSFQNQYGTSGLMSPSQPYSNAMFNGYAPTRLMPHQFPDRAMPSPIREDSMDDGSTAEAGSQLSRLSMSEAMMDVDDGSADPFGSMSELASPGLASPTDGSLTPRKTRARSGAITTNKRIFMGYMPDCDKCRDKVPGHVMHILSG